MTAAGPFDELGQLAAGLCDGDLSPLDKLRLETLLGDSVESRRFFLQYMQLHGELAWEAGKSLGPAAVEGVSCPAPLPVAVPSRTIAGQRWAMVLAAVLLAGLLFVFAGKWSGASKEEPAGDGKPIAQVAGQGEKANQATPATPPVAEAGSVAALRQLVAKHPALLHHYTFEGDSPQERAQDKHGTLHLVPVVMRDGRLGGTLAWPDEGFDATTKAIQPYRSKSWGNSTGEALQSEADFHPPAQMTVELLLQFQEQGSDEENPISAAVATRANDRQASFLLAAAVSGTLVQLFDADSPWIEGESPAEPPKWAEGNHEFFFRPGDWYYVATTLKAEGECTRVSTYLADLTRGEKRLVPVVKDQLAPGHPATSRLGIGKGFNETTAHAYPWSGALDEVAIYGEMLDLGALEKHSGLLHPPTDH